MFAYLKHIMCQSYLKAFIDTPYLKQLFLKKKMCFN